MIDVNDEVPWFEESQYEGQISENQPPGTSVLTVSAFDLDQGRTCFLHASTTLSVRSECKIKMS